MATATKYASYNTVVTTGWTNPTNAYSEDNTNYATSAPGKGASITTDYGFAAFSTSDIPEGSRINSVTATINWKNATWSTGSLIGLQLNDNGSLVDSESTWNQDQAADTDSSVQDTTTITIADLGNADYVKARVRSYRATGGSTAVTFSLDSVRLIVDYTPVVNVIGQAQVHIRSIANKVYAQSQAHIRVTDQKGYAQSLALIGRTDLLYSAVDEVSPDESDYLVSPAGSTQYAEIKLAVGPAPTWPIEHYFNFRFLSATGISVRLYCGTTEVTSVGGSSASWSTYSYKLSPSEIALISDYSDLRVRVASSDAAGRALLSWVELNIPSGVSAKLVSGQAQAHIRTLNVQNYGQAQAHIIIRNTRVYGQAQSQIRRTYQVVANAQADIRATYQNYANSQADIRATYRVHANAQADIRATYYVHGQAQSDIRSTYRVYANAQADIRATYQVYAQAQSDIRSTYRVYGQAQSLIRATYRSSGQAQAQIRATYFGYAQALATILAQITTSNTYAQAQALVYIPVYYSPTADISNNGWVRTVRD